MSYEFTDYVYGEQGSMTDEEAIAHVDAVFNAPRTSFVVRDGAFFAPNIRAYYTEQDLVDRTEANLRTMAALAGQ